LGENTVDVDAPLGCLSGRGTTVDDSVGARKRRPREAGLIGPYNRAGFKSIGLRREAAQSGTNDDQDDDDRRGNPGHLVEQAQALFTQRPLPAR
jgi:hypothetical protein